MQRIGDSFERRDVLELAGGALAGVGATGLGAASLDDAVRVNVGYAADSGRRAALAAADEVVHELDVLDAVTVRLPRKAAEALAERRDVRYVERDGRLRALAESYPWAVDRVDADVAHANGHTGAGTDVAIVDTGIDSDHPDLQANLGNGKAFVSCTGRHCNYAWDDDNDHGTYCAGLAAAADNGRGIVGVAPEATLHAVKVLDSNGTGSYSDVAAGIRWAADEGHDVINVSLGGSSGSSVLRDAVEYAYHDRGAFLAGAAGGSGPCSDCVGYPAAYDEVVAVGATNCSDGLASFSSQGPEIELVAPGESVRSTVIGDYATWSGTSGPTAVVSGAAALLVGTGYATEDARKRLCSTAEDLGLASEKQGCGLLDAAAALGYGSSDDGGC
jgi:subtilisin